jgi:uncharacterized protein (UPF0548 family)
MTGLRLPDPSRLGKALERADQTSPSYPEVGASLGELPGGYRHLTRDLNLGTGPELFATMTEAILSWRLHRTARLTVTATAARAVTGATVLLSARIGPVWVTAPCRVITAVADPRWAGFVYGTLPGHPERGEECFSVKWREDDSVWATITAFSAAATSLARIGGPFVRHLQDSVTDRYLRAAAELAKSSQAAPELS